jgi:medium-chain acyl-[acyl-carrier-protein] hydrolase
MHRWLSGDATLHAPVRLCCFPYAGGSESVFRTWQPRFGDVAQVCAFRLPGRGLRSREPPFTDLPALVRAASDELALLVEQPFAFFGHSMGALIAFELARQLRRDYRVEPVHLFVSGACSPDSVQFLHDLDPAAIRETLRTLDGTPREIIDHRRFMDSLVPIVRADFTLCVSYKYVEDRPFDCPITAFGGLGDVGISKDCLMKWDRQTTSRFDAHFLEGNHFFLHSSEEALKRTIARELCQSR